METSQLHGTVTVPGGWPETSRLHGTVTVLGEWTETRPDNRLKISRIYGPSIITREKYINPPSPRPSRRLIADFIPNKGSRNHKLRLTLSPVTSSYYFLFIS